MRKPGTVTLAADYWATQASEEKAMADNINNTGGGSGNTGLAFIIGAIVVVLAVVAYFVFARGGAPETKQVDVNVDLPEVSAPAVPGTGG